MVLGCSLRGLSAARQRKNLSTSTRLVQYQTYFVRKRQIDALGHPHHTHHHHQQLASATAGGQLVMVVRMVADNLWHVPGTIYLVRFPLTQQHTTTYRCRTPQLKAAITTTITTTTNDALLLLLLLVLSCCCWCLT